MDVVANLSRVQNETTRQEEPRVLVHSEDDPERMLLETRICKEDGFQKQQGTYSMNEHCHKIEPRGVANSCEQKR